MQRLTPLSQAPGGQRQAPLQPAMGCGEGGDGEVTWDESELRGLALAPL